MAEDYETRNTLRNYVENQYPGATTEQKEAIVSRLNRRAFSRLSDLFISLDSGFLVLDTDGQPIYSWLDNSPEED